MRRPLALVALAAALLPAAAASAAPQPVQHKVETSRFHADATGRTAAAAHIVSLCKRA